MKKFHFIVSVVLALFFLLKDFSIINLANEALYEQILEEETDGKTGENDIKDVAGNNDLFIESFYGQDLNLTHHRARQLSYYLLSIRNNPCNEISLPPPEQLF